MYGPLRLSRPLVSFPIQCPPASLRLGCWLTVSK
jgi:hypothetical protein